MSASQILQRVVLQSKKMFVVFLFFSTLGVAEATDSAKAIKAVPKSPTTERTQKATILMRISSWVEWPAVNGENRKDLNICLLGKFDGPIELGRINQQVVDQKKLLVRPVDNLEACKTGCDLIYISNSEAAKQKSIIDAFADKPVLTVADIEDFAKAGGSMNFTHINDKLGVTINLESMGKVNLPLSPNAYRRITIVPEESELKN